MVLVPAAATDVHRQLLTPSDLVQNPVCTNEEEKSKLKRKRALSSEAEDIDDTTPRGCKTSLSLYDDPWKKKKVLTATNVHRQLLTPSDLVQNPVCTDEEEKSKLKRKRALSSEAEDIDDTTPRGCKTGLSLYDDPWKMKKVLTATNVHRQLLRPSDLVQNPVCTDEEEKSKLRALSSEAEDIDDTTPWGCKTALSLYDDPWKIKKVLTGTDVQGHHNRLLLPSNLVQSLVCPILTDEENSKLDSGEGTEIKFRDVDNNNMSVHSLLLKKWPSSGSFVLIGNWTSDFVKRRELKEGDQIGLQWDKYYHRFNFTVLPSVSRSSVPVKLSGSDHVNKV